DDEPTGTASAVPASRVENLRLIGANPAPPANQVGFTWDPVPGAALYEVQVSLSENFNSADDTVTMKCTTPHTTLTPYLSGEYSGREAVDTGCNTMLPLLSATTYYVRVRAVDMPTDPDYPEASEAKPVYGLWSDQRRETAEAVPDPLTVTPSANAGSGSIGQAATPLSGTGTHPDIPLLTWEPTPAAASYRVVIALDRDFTNRVATYATNTAALMPGEVYDEVNAGQAYHWFAIPCTQDDPIADCDTAERAAINHPSKVATFGRRSIATTGLSTTSTDAGRHVVLRWNDALTATEAADPGYATGGVSRYEVQVTLGDWAEAKAFETDNLAWATTREPLAGGNYRWRVRGLDGQDVSMKWAYGSDFTIAAPGAAPVPTDPPGSGTPADPSSPADPGTTPEYQAPPPEDGSAKSVPPAKPGKPKVKAVNDRTVKVQWRRSTELGVPVSKYLLYRSKDGNRFVRVRRTQAAQTRILVTPGTVYWFRVVADSSAGSSKPSRPTKFRMPGA
ncbi:MAG: fibronectin type III domain-containing protein, partial [Candidatus Nanopelagicales bacterium]|nr:fibronectin type III domain-containing protein [Candidatus Nanopelagicales bacterium]